MVTLDYIRASALAHSHTVVGRAFCRALGIKPKRSAAKRGNAALVAEERRMRGLRWCFENHGSPMDRGR